LVFDIENISSGNAVEFCFGSYGGGSRWVGCHVAYGNLDSEAFPKG
jgi:hypothetical protein